MKRTLALVVALTGVFVVILQVLSPLSVSAAFNQNNIIDDSVFNASNSMNASQIDAFLNSFPNSCISTNNGFSAPDVVGYNPTDGFLYGPNVSAGNIINNAAKAYDLNPQVILATLQKEQSLVSGNAGCHYETPPTQNPCPNPPYGTYQSCVVACQYSGGCVYIAMGYDCPQYCVPNSTGFSKQIIKATWKLKFVQQRSLGNYGWNIQKPGWNNSDDPPTPYNGYMTQGYLKRSTSSNPANYDGLRPVNNGSVTVHLDNGATASLYSYTPFLSGNQSFYNRFTEWFGSTHAYVASEAPDRKAGEGGGNTSSWSPGKLDLFIQGTNVSGPNMWYKSFSSDVGWSDYLQDPPMDESVRVTSQISAVSWEPGRIDIFARSEDATLIHKYYRQYFGWSSWEDLGGCIIDAPSVSSWAANRLDIFVQGCNETGPNMYHKWWNNGSWYGWEAVPNLNARITSAPSAISWGPNRIDIFMRGEGGDLIHNWYGGVWHGIDSLGGCIVGQPAVSAWGPGRLDVFVQGCDVVGANVWHRWYDNDRWGSWELNPQHNNTRITSMVGAVSWSNHRFDIFARGTDGTLMHQWYDRSWGPWESLGGGLAP